MRIRRAAEWLSAQGLLPEAAAAQPAGTGGGAASSSGGGPWTFTRSSRTKRRTSSSSGGPGPPLAPRAVAKEAENVDMGGMTPKSPVPEELPRPEPRRCGYQEPQLHLRRLAS